MIKSGMGLAAILTDVLPMLADAAMKQTRLLVKQSAATPPERTLSLSANRLRDDPPLKKRGNDGC